MKISPTPHRRALAALVPALILFAAPAVAQETPPAPPPPVAVEQPAVPAPIQTTVTPPAVVPTLGIQPSTALDDAVAGAAPAARPVAVRPAPVRHVAQARNEAARVTRPAPATSVVAMPAPVARSPAPAAVSSPPPVAATATDTAQTPTQDSGVAALWPWLVAGVVALLAIFGLVASRRRKREDVGQATYAAQPAYIEEPVAAPLPMAEAFPAHAPIVTHEPQFLRPAPVAHDIVTNEEAPVAIADSAELVAPDAAEVDALTAGAAPVADRPWLEMAMRPVRAGTNSDEAVVEIELTVGNAGSVAANDVRISTFMFAGAPDSGEMERMLVERDAGGVPPVTIQPGEGTMLEATLALPREALDGELSPVIVADARYPLPGGGEGRTSASFRIGVTEEDGVFSPIRIGRPHMTETVEAELYGTPERV